MVGAITLRLVRPLVRENTTPGNGGLPGSRGLFRAGRPYGLGALIVVAVVIATVSGRLPLLILAVIAVAGAVWVAIRPQRGILLAAALVPFDGLRLPLGIGGSLASWKEGLALFTGACAAVSAQRVARRVRPDWFWWLVAYVGLCLVWFVWHQSKASIWGLKLDFVYLSLTFAAWRCPLTRRDRDRFVSILMAAGVLTAAYGVLQQILGHQ